ncbi:MAG TPA: hypothetical protein VIK22_05505 [Candidatus Anoxymicrobiaceae bacterium]
MNGNTNLARSVLVATLAMLLLSSLMALPGCSPEGQEVMRVQYRWGPARDATISWSHQEIGFPVNSKGGIGTLYSISAADAEHVWAVGNGGEIDALENGTWKQSFVTKPNDFLFSVSALDRSHVWAVGFNEREQYAAIWFFDGTSWRQQAAGEFKGVTLNSVYALGSRHVWAVGKGGTILFFDGSSWTRQTSDTNVELRSVSAVNPSQVWATGIDETGGKSALLYYDGTSWKNRDPGNGLSFGTISAIDASQVWAIGGNRNQPGSSGVYCFDGSHWVLSLQEAPEFVPTTVYPIASNNILVPGMSYAPGGPYCEIALFNGRSWNIQQAGVEPGYGFDAITAADPSHLWAVGRDMVPTASVVSRPSEIYFGTNQH